jgi:hypothetical protein
VTDKATAGRAQVLEAGQACSDEGRTDAFPLMLGLDRDRAEAAPAEGAVGNAYRREGDMSDDVAFSFRQWRIESEKSLPTFGSRRAVGG